MASTSGDSTTGAWLDTELFVSFIPDVCIVVALDDSPTTN